MRVTECDVDNALLSGDCDPYAVVVPNETCVVAACSVVQVMVAELALIAVAVTDEIIGAGSAGVAKVKFAEVVEMPPPLTEMAA